MAGNTTKNWWELSDEKVDAYLDKLSLDELVKEKTNLNGLKDLDKKQIKARDNAIKQIDTKMDYKKMMGGTFTDPPSGGGRVTSEVETKTSKPKTTPATVSTPKTNTTTSTTKATPTEQKLNTVVEKGNEVADEFNSGELGNKKTEDAKNATENAKNRSLTVDDSLELNSPNWFLNEAKEIAPTDKAKRGFLITNHIFNTLGTGLGNIGATVQNNGGSGGGTIKDYNSYIDQYRQSKMNQVLANRKAKQDNMLQQQINAIMKIGASEDEAIEIQNRLRNAEFRNKYKRLSNEEQVLLQALLYYDNRGQIGDALIGDMVDRMLNGEKVSAEDTITTVLTSSGIDDAASLKNKINNFAKDPVNGLKKGIATIFGYNLPEE